MSNDFLPIGSVVMLKDASRAILIIGYTVVEEGKKNKIWDYLGCAYPFGVIGSDKNLLFNRNQIDKVISRGYEDDECKKFINLLTIDYKKIKK